MRKNAFIYINGSIYILVEDERLVPPNKIAARVSLTAGNMVNLMNKSWKEYQSLLEHYFDIGQKLVTA
jgi:hypothetical protein